MEELPNKYIDKPVGMPNEPEKKAEWQEKWHKEVDNLEKQAKWDEISSKVEKITDKRGKPIDQGIKETVIAMMANGLPTHNSCEGHLDHGRPYSFVDIGFEITSSEFAKKLTDLSEKAKAKGYKEKYALMIPDTDLELYPILKKLRSESESYKEKIEVTIKAALDSFYSIHTPVSEDYVLTVAEGGSFFSIEPASGAGIGKENWNKFKLKEEGMSHEEKKNYLENTQAEMKAFAEFLKNKFFSDSKQSIKETTKQSLKVSLARENKIKQTEEEIRLLQDAAGDDDNDLGTQSAALNYQGSGNGGSHSSNGRQQSSPHSSLAHAGSSSTGSVWKEMGSLFKKWLSK